MRRADGLAVPVKLLSAYGRVWLTRNRSRELIVQIDHHVPGWRSRCKHPRTVSVLDRAGTSVRFRRPGEVQRSLFFNTVAGLCLDVLHRKEMVTGRDVELGT